ncbi:helix-turn-helix domain-containing protein [Mesorhizobium sp. M1A.F.Ca.ET.072.01.1.1]|uniref:recombinase family protein n=1 Tax=Mesorhizobium sp. M1A.F.Ca.ET.072.01.1.1 TaxID=2496753 RepID=UPI000FD2C417|nr:recombinase family protein [Mesorhizobium sp. M1A.F.Ca.ET.072.01.1.1]RUW48930.1 helix-turn-helix domain-containing protein [Mesorhizobium sp. M1A.F.Ca.ET.072.01.1.1]TIU94843.1 MAG: helix-turn-helix domain-containing protein [Mesorhizobium sp.]
MKITVEHLARGAFVYVRQSTADQLVNNPESRRRQYGLAERARALGWTDVTVIDEDLGRSGSGISRPGFERLLAAICEGRVGAVLAIEASRLARNGRDWHTLIEFCGLVGTLIIDEDGIYEPRHPNDRLLLGMKGTMSELELSILRARSIEALKQKARRGELFLTVAVGYVRAGRDRIEKDANLRVREAIALVFSRFAGMQSIRQVHLSLRNDGIVLPCVSYSREGGRAIVWKLPVYNTVHHILTNPIYAGAYAFGRTGSRVTIENGRKRIVRGFRKEQSEWEVLLVDHHEGYLSWAEYGRNQRLIADNANGKGMMMARGALRRGELLLGGLLRCGHCGRKLHVAYSGKNGNTGRYHCRGAQLNHGTESCISFGSLRVDLAVGAEVVRLLQPLGVEAALQAIEARRMEAGERRRQIELALEQARYEAALARRQYDAVDPDNRLVASELERRWNAALVVVQEREAELRALGRHQLEALSDDERQALLRMGADLEAAWHHPAATAASRKRILRAVLREIVVRIENEQIELMIHWQGGDHTVLAVKKNRAGQHRWIVEPETETLIRHLARLMPDKAIASLLNRLGKKTGRLNGWTQSRVCSFRSKHGIAVYQEGERAARGEVTLNEAADILNLSPMTVLRMIRSRILPAEQHCKGAPWVIRREDLENPDVGDRSNASRKRPLTSNPDQQILVFQ